MVTQDGRIVFLSLRARNYDNTVRFYRDVVGIQLEVTAHSDEGPHAEYSWHNPYFHFAVVPAGSQEEPTRTEIALNIRDVQSVHAKAVAAGIRALEDPRQEPCGFGATYLDPDGNTAGVY